NDFPIVVDTCHASTSITVNFTAVDECGNIVTTSAVVTLMGTLGTSAPALSGFEFTVSPNPAHDQLKVVMDKAESLFVHLILFNVFGHQILSIREVTGEINVDVTGIAPGLYLVHARSNKGAYTLKVIVE
ncbi:MAG: T9SS type A sorting domain-containing protein, partial [Saprospiraceae bacterium]|nr:T9SS type A sorting domain-containing protein [Saprospiraceae bacterium]